MKTLTTEKPRLTGQQAIAIALFSRGLNRHEIADEMMIGYDHLNMVLRRAAAKGYDVPLRLHRSPEIYPQKRPLAHKHSLARMVTHCCVRCAPPNSPTLLVTCEEKRSFAGCFYE